MTSPTLYALPPRRPALTPPPASLDEAVEAALARSVSRLRDRQSADGAWRSDCDQGPAVTAQAAIALAWVGAMEPSLAEATCRWLLSRQLPGGGWPAAPFSAQPDPGATATCLAALVRLGCLEEAPLRRAWQAMEGMGGLGVLAGRIREADTAAWFVAMAGLLDARALPRLPLRWRRVGPLVRLLEHATHDGVQLLFAQLAAIQRALTGEWGADARLHHPDARAVIELLDTYQNDDGSWAGFVPIHALALCAMHACGERGSRLQRGRRWLRARAAHSEEGTWFSAYDPDIWVTGISLRALRLAGVPEEDPAVQRGAGWLLGGQSRRPLARALQRQPGAPRIGGWGFGATNTTLPDTDDTGIALLALSMCADLPGALDAIAAGQEYLLAMQNPDGGFPAFTWNLSRRSRQPPRLLAPGAPAAGLRGLRDRLRVVSLGLSDPASEDLAGRVLRALAACGLSLRDAPVQRAVAWLEAAQAPSGGWWGKWVTPYMIPTADVLSGLHAVGMAVEHPAVQGGLGFLLARQQEDGGWGDTPAAYLDASRAGRAPASCPVTAWVLTGLLPWLGAGHPAVERGIRFLLARQEDGGWPNGEHTHVYLPPDRTYVLPATALMHGVEALALWRSARRAADNPA